MSIELPTDVEVDLSSSIDDGRVGRPGRVAARSPLTVVELAGPVPGWCTDEADVALTADVGTGRYRWTARVDTVDRPECALRLRDVSTGTFVERRRAPRLDAPYPVDWSTVPGGVVRCGEGLDLNHLGLRFTTPHPRPASGERLVVTVRTSMGPTTVFGTVVGSDDDGVQVVIDHLHPESLRRLSAWEAEQSRAALAGQVLGLLRPESGAPPDAGADPPDQPS